MSKPKISSAIDLLIPSIDVIKNNLLTFFVLSVVPSLLSILGTKRVENPTSFADIAKTITPLSLLGSLLAFLFFAPLIYTLVNTTKGKHVNLLEAFSKGYHYFFRLIGLLFIFATLMIVGFIFFIIPGIIVIRRYFLSFYYLVDQNMSIKDAMTKSAGITIQNSMAIYSVMGIMLIFGLFASIPGVSAVIGYIFQFLYSVAPALRYQEMKQVYDTKQSKNKK